MSTVSLASLSGIPRRAQPLFRSVRPLLTVDDWTTSRTYNTSGQRASSPLLTSALDQKQRASHSTKEDSVGPFQLGISQASLRRGEKAKKWSELSVGGKVLRTTQRTTNLTVILLGAGLSAVLVYALTSELFSKNSPTVLYNDACERIETSPRVSKYLHAPLVFHNNPPSSVRPRHRHRHVASQIVIDSSGREHMLLNFYVQGSFPVSLPTEDEKDGPWSSYVRLLTSLTFEDVKEITSPLIDSAKSAFKYLRGDAVPVAIPPTATDKHKNVDQERTEEHSWWGVTGLFSGLRGRRSHDRANHGTGPTWTEGEVHADLVRVRSNVNFAMYAKSVRAHLRTRCIGAHLVGCPDALHADGVTRQNDEGYFEFRYLLLDIPNSENRNPIRVFVERTQGVRENEPIMRFHSS